MWSRATACPTSSSLSFSSYTCKLDSPFDRLAQFYDFDQINEAAAAESGATIKPILRIAQRMPERFEDESMDDKARLDEMFAPPPGSLKWEPKQQVIARLPGPDEAAAAVAALIDAGIAADKVFVLCGDGAAQRLDPTGRHHGLKGRLIRAAQTIFGAGLLIAEDAQFLEDGGVIVAAPARDAQERKTVTKILREQSGAQMRYHGDMTWEDVG